MSDRVRYFVPGPTWVRPEILEEMTRPMIGHRSREFRDLFRTIRDDLRLLFRTSQQTFVATSSGTGILEAALRNCVPRSVLVTTCGAFSERWLKIAEALGLEVDHLDVPWGEAIDPARLGDFLRGRRHHYDAVTFTHSETSTGVLNDIRTLASVVHETSEDTLVLVDAVSSLAAAPIEFDQWGLDVCVASVQKGLALPPGITVFAVSERAIATAEKKRYRGFYFDFAHYRKQADDDGAPFTPAIPQYYALSKQLDHILRVEGLEARWDRHATMRDLTLQRTAEYARPIAPAGFASPSVSALHPTAAGAAEIVSEMRARGYTLGGGYGAWKESSFRIGHMGDIGIADLEAMLDDLGEVAR